MGEGTYLSIFLVVIRGENDDLLQWPFQQEVSFKLIDPVGDRNISDTLRPVPSRTGFQRPSSNMNITGGCPMFVPKSMLNSRGYIHDDAVSIEIAVATTVVPSHVEAL
jgi:hypothetical protein